MNAFPQEDQWQLLTEHGIQGGFHGLWVEGNDLDEIVRQVRADPHSRVECDLQALLEMLPGQGGDTIWTGPVASGWTHILAFGWYPNHPAIRNLGRRRVFEIHYQGELSDLEPLNLYYDGVYIGDVTPPYEEGGDMYLPDYRQYANGLALGDKPTLERCVHLMLCMVGRITGHFLDRDWFGATRTMYRIPESSWGDSW
ncbi:hypothetical protein ACFXJ8_43750 [Nonomuraea sp. NPDC059194]|uniref:hypothetical protein n=1 Tax=Nonomuraea sp. NPDC059194 TaxID=3346764 RepID=UPI00367A2549